MSMFDWILYIATYHAYLIYILILLVAFFEGPIIALTVGFLTFVGFLNIWLSILILILGNVIPDITLYYIGRLGRGKRFINRHFLKFKFISENIKLMEKMWKHHPWKTIFFGKMASGFSIPVLITLGLIKTPFKNFFYYTSIMNIFQASIIFFIGYNLGFSYLVADKYIKFIGIFFAILLVVFIAGYYLTTKYFVKKFLEEEKEEEQSM